MVVIGVNSSCPWGHTAAARATAAGSATFHRRLVITLRSALATGAVSAVQRSFAALGEAIVAMDVIAPNINRPRQSTSGPRYAAVPCNRVISTDGPTHGGTTGACATRRRALVRALEANGSDTVATVAEFGASPVSTERAFTAETTVAPCKFVTEIAVIPTGSGVVIVGAAACRRAPPRIPCPCTTVDDIKRAAEMNQTLRTIAMLHALA